MELNMSSTWASIDIAMQFLRPSAKYQLEGTTFTVWADPRPQPSWEEVLDTMEKIRQFEASINTLYLEDYLSQEKAA